jgi:hypothetical protein
MKSIKQHLKDTFGTMFDTEILPYIKPDDRANVLTVSASQALRLAFDWDKHRRGIKFWSNMASILESGDQQAIDALKELLSPTPKPAPAPAPEPELPVAASPDSSIPDWAPPLPPCPEGYHYEPRGFGWEAHRVRFLCVGREDSRWMQVGDHRCPRSSTASFAHRFYVEIVKDEVVETTAADTYQPATRDSLLPGPSGRYYDPTVPELNQGRNGAPSIEVIMIDGKPVLPPCPEGYHYVERGFGWEKQDALFIWTDRPTITGQCRGTWGGITTQLTPCNACGVPDAFYFELVPNEHEPSAPLDSRTYNILSMQDGTGVLISINVPDSIPDLPSLPRGFIGYRPRGFGWNNGGKIAHYVSWDPFVSRWVFDYISAPTGNITLGSCVPLGIPQKYYVEMIPDISSGHYDLEGRRRPAPPAMPMMDYHWEARGTEWNIAWLLDTPLSAHTVGDCAVLTDRRFRFSNDFADGTYFYVAVPTPSIPTAEQILEDMHRQARLAMIVF